ncbi:methionyl-tRNA formyltransferase [Rhodoligotrophos appendicifer]
MGTPGFSVPPLAEILSQGHEVVAVYTQPPRPAGRGMGVRKSAVQSFAESHGLTVRHPASLKTEAEQAEFAALRPDVAIVVAYGLLLPQAILDAPVQGCLNIHASLLPRWRGAAPIQRAIMAGDPETGVSIMRMEAGLDTGPVCLSERVPIEASTTASELHDTLSAMGASLIGKALTMLSEGSLHCTPQPEAGVTYARKIDKAEAHLNLELPADQVLRHINGLSPSPGAWVIIGPQGAAFRLKLLKAEISPESGVPATVLDDRLLLACGTQAIRPLVVQREGKGPMALADFLRGTSIQPGSMVR